MPAGPSYPPAVFFDRDDTLIACRSMVPDGDLGDPALVRLLPGAAGACRMLREAGFRVIVFSNQGGVARGKYGLDAVEAVNARVNALLGGTVDDFRVCPWHPEGTVPEFSCEHPWRKPAPGMILDAAGVHGLDLSRSWVIGDAERDCLAGKGAGLHGRTILLTNPDPDLEPSHLHGMASAPDVADFLAPDLQAAASIVLSKMRASA